MKRKKIDSFTLFVILLLALILTLLGMLLAGMKEEKRQFTVLLPLGDLAYDEDFLQKAKKIKGIKEIWPVIEVPVVIKIEDYTETTTFSGIDMNAFGKNPTQNELGKMPLLLLGELETEVSIRCILGLHKIYGSRVYAERRERRACCYDTCEGRHSVV